MFTQWFPMAKDIPFFKFFHVPMFPELFSISKRKMSDWFAHHYTYTSRYHFVVCLHGKNLPRTTKLRIFFKLVWHMLVNGSCASSANLMSRIFHLLRIFVDTKSTDAKAIDGNAK